MHSPASFTASDNFHSSGSHTTSHWILPALLFLIVLTIIPVSVYVLSTFVSTPNSSDNSINSLPPPTPKPTEGKFCAGLAGLQCPTGYTCRLDGDYPDAGGKCIKKK